MQKGIADKLIPQLERLIIQKLEVSISRQLQTQFQTVGKQALQVFLFQQFTCRFLGDDCGMQLLAVGCYF